MVLSLVLTAFFSVTQITEKQREHNISINTDFKDYKKDFSGVKWNKLWWITEKLPQCCTILICRNHKKKKCTGIRCKALVRQGCPLEPAFFHTYTDGIIKNG